MMKQEQKALAISSLLVFVGILVGATVLWQAQAPKSSLSEPEQQTALIETGRSYIASIVSYDAQINAPIVFLEASLQGDITILSYEVEQARHKYYYRLEMIDGEVARHYVSVSDTDHQLLVTHPEPGQLLTNNVISVKGQASSDLDVVTIRLKSDQGRVLWERSTEVVSVKDRASFFLEERVLAVSNGSAILEVEGRDAQIIFPVQFYLE